jgi:murein DD-endopeptidase MepM/ murein hydrolase activator NlpD
VSASTARHRRQAQPAQEAAALPRHRKASGSPPRRFRAAARSASVLALLLVAAAGTFAVVAHLPASGLEPQASAQAQRLGRLTAQAGTLVTKTEVTKVLAASAQPAGTSKAATTPAGRASTPPAPAPPVYVNPLRAITDLIPQRVDMGVDFAGSGPIYALGDGVITNAEGDNEGWPGGGWITYQLTNGPAAGLVVYVAEDVTPTVQVGDQVTSSTVVAQMYNGGDGIETGWATPDSSTAESQLAVAGGIGGDGPFPTEVGLSFDALLVALGVPAAPNAVPVMSGYGLLPSNIPAQWSGLS